MFVHFWPLSIRDLLSVRPKGRNPTWIPSSNNSVRIFGMKFGLVRYLNSSSENCFFAKLNPNIEHLNIVVRCSDSKTDELTLFWTFWYFWGTTFSLAIQKKWNHFKKKLKKNHLTCMKSFVHFIIIRKGKAWKKESISSRE